MGTYLVHEYSYANRFFVAILRDYETAWLIQNVSKT